MTPMPVYIVELLANLSEDERPDFCTRYTMKWKSPVTATQLALFLGGLGLHWFYLGARERAWWHILLCSVLVTLFLLIPETGVACAGIYLVVMLPQVSVVAMWTRKRNRIQAERIAWTLINQRGRTNA